jgi:hypothetical protein
MSEKAVLTPKFLTPGLLEQAVGLVIDMVGNRPPLKDIVKFRGCHIVVLVPSMEDARAEDYPNWPDYPSRPHPIYERSINKDAWTANYDDIAKCKALQLWHDRNDDRTDIMPHLLFAGDTRHYGGVKRHGIVVTCSGVDPWFDKMISGMIADMIIALSYDAWMKSEENKKNLDWLS